MPSAAAMGGSSGSMAYMLSANDPTNMRTCEVIFSFNTVGFLTIAYRLLESLETSALRLPGRDEKCGRLFLATSLDL